MMTDAHLSSQSTDGVQHKWMRCLLLRTALQLLISWAQGTVFALVLLPSHLQNQGWLVPLASDGLPRQWSKGGVSRTSAPYRLCSALRSPDSDGISDAGTPVGIIPPVWCVGCCAYISWCWSVKWDFLLKFWNPVSFCLLLLLVP